jgi:putative phosphoribosyl transferase
VAARALGLPVGVWSARKLGVPGDEELAMGAVASGGIVVLRPEILREAHVSDAAHDEAILHARDDRRRGEERLRTERPPPEVGGRVAIVVDDGLATGATRHAVVASLRRRKPAAIVTAVPVGSREACEDLLGEVDELVCLVTPEPFEAVAQGYEDFTQATDDERGALSKAAEPRGGTGSGEAAVGS